MADDSGEHSAIDLAALGHLLREKADGSKEREVYLEELRKKIQSGEYRVDSEALARKLIEDAERKSE